MILYNVTVKILPEVVEEWEKWMKAEHIPDVLATGLFQWARFSKLLSLDTEDGITFSIQYSCSNMKDLHLYQAQFAQQLQKDHTDKFKDKFVAFRSIMEEIDFQEV